VSRANNGTGREHLVTLISPESKKSREKKRERKYNPFSTPEKLQRGKKFHWNQRGVPLQRTTGRIVQTADPDKIYAYGFFD
jgi:hypothetical protein